MKLFILLAVLTIGCCWVYMRFPSFRSRVDSLKNKSADRMGNLCRSVLANKSVPSESREKEEYEILLRKSEEEVQKLKEAYEKQHEENRKFRTDLERKIRTLEEAHKSVFAIKDTVTFEFRNEYLGITTLVNNAEGVLMDIYGKLFSHVHTLDISVAENLFSYFREKPFSNILKWNTIHENLQSRIVCGSIKSSLANENDECKQLMILRTMVFDELYRPLINNLLLTLEQIRFFYIDGPYGRELTTMIEYLLTGLERVGIHVIYYPIGNAAANLDYANIEVVDRHADLDGVIAKILAYGINSSQLPVMKQKTLVEIKTEIV